MKNKSKKTLLASFLAHRLAIVPLGMVTAGLYDLMMSTETEGVQDKEGKQIR
jgi:hypothetical protein